MEEGIRSGQMEVFMKAIGLKTRQMVVEDLYMLMEIFMMDFGKMIKHTDMGNILIQMEHSMKEIGLMTNNMA